MAPPSTTKILDVCRVPPTSDSPLSTTELSLPTTFFDLYWLKFPPVERLFFFQLTQPTPDFFTVILPKLKHSLSLSLLHYLPLAGRLIWPPDSPKPFILYSPNDGVLLTVAESDADFDRLSSTNGAIEAIEYHPYIPKLPISESESSVIALQITLFPNKGFSIGCTSNHAVLDGKSSTMFIKAWAHISKHNNPSLLPELTPFFDRRSVKDPSELGTLFISQWAALTEPESKTNPRSLKVLPDIGVPKDQVRTIFQLTRRDTNKLKNKVSSELRSPVPLSSFAVTCAYVSVCMVKARGGDKNTKIWFIFPADCRNRLQPPLPENYFGNCICPHDFVTEASEYTKENAVSAIAEKLGSKIKEIEKEPLAGVENTLPGIGSISEEMRMISVGGSTKFGVYGCDFGWGKPKKVEMVSIDRTGAIGLNESGDANGGIEISLALPRNEMDAFSYMLFNGLKDL